MRSTERTSLGLTRRQAALVAYSAGWITGLVVLWLEGQDRDTRWHAAQSTVGFGLLALAGVLCMAVATIGLLSSMIVFRIGLVGVQVVVAVGIALWAWSLVRVALGGTPRWPLIGARVDALADPSRSA
ncbi:MAG: hypothetical protein IT182_01405 [Acidobacteria bacterium]|nr:hypothetical protein [Acidobacteriota bacterium]